MPRTFRHHFRQEVLLAIAMPSHCQAAALWVAHKLVSRSSGDISTPAFDLIWFNWFHLLWFCIMFISGHFNLFGLFYPCLMFPKHLMFQTSSCCGVLHQLAKTNSVPWWTLKPLASPKDKTICNLSIPKKAPKRLEVGLDPQPTLPFYSFISTPKKTSSGASTRSSAVLLPTRFCDWKP